MRGPDAAPSSQALRPQPLVRRARRVTGFSSACSSRTNASATRNTRRRVAGFAVRRITLILSSFGRGLPGADRRSATSTPRALASRTSVSKEGLEFAEDRPRSTRSRRATVSTVTPARAASSAWVRPASSLSCRTCSANRVAISVTWSSQTPALEHRLSYDLWVPCHQTCAPGLSGLGRSPQTERPTPSRFGSNGKTALSGHVPHQRG